MRHITDTNPFYHDLQKANPRSITGFAKSMKIYTNANKLLLEYLDSHNAGIRVTKGRITDLFTVNVIQSFYRPPSTVAFNIPFFPKNDIYIFTDKHSLETLSQLGIDYKMDNEYDVLNLIYDHECLHAFMNVKRSRFNAIADEIFEIACRVNADFDLYQYDKDLHDTYAQIFTEATSEARKSQELITYGLTMPELYLLLKQIPYEDGNCFEKMCDVLFRIDEDNVLRHYIKTKFDYPPSTSEEDLLRLRLRLRMQMEQQANTMEEGGISEKITKYSENAAFNYGGLLKYNEFMTYNEIKQEISNVFNEKRLIERDIDVAKRRIDKYSDLKKYISENVGYTYTTSYRKQGSKNYIQVFVLPKSEPDVVEKTYNVDSENVLLRLKKIDNSNKYKWYEIDEVINDDGLNDLLKSKIPIIEKEISNSEKKYAELDRKILQLKKQLANTENPNLATYKDELLMLKEAEKSAISQTHKDKINSLIYRIEENGRLNYESFAIAWYMGAKQYVTNIIKQLGGKRYHKSAKDVRGSVYYNLPNNESVRISDHELPETKTRIANRQAGWGGNWIEIILDTPKPFDELKKEVLETIFEQIGHEGEGNEYNLKTQEIKNKIEKLNKQSFFDASDPDIRFEQGGAVATERKLLAPNGKPTNLTFQQWHLVRTPEFKAWFGDWQNDPANASKVVDENGEPLICFHGTTQIFHEFRGDVGRANDYGFYGNGFYFTFGHSNYSKSEAAYYGANVLECFIKSDKPFDFSLLGNYKGQRILLMFYMSYIFLSNIAEMFPEIAESIKINKSTKVSDDVFETKAVSINVLPKLIEKYAKQLKTYKRINNRGEEVIIGYVKSKTVHYDYTKNGGKKGSYVQTEDLCDIDSATDPVESEFVFIVEAIKKYEGINLKYLPEGYTTRNPQITDAIKSRGHDSIMQSVSGDELVVFEPTQIKLADGSNTTFDASDPDIRFERGGKLKEFQIRAESLEPDESMAYYDTKSLHEWFGEYTNYYVQPPKDKSTPIKIYRAVNKQFAGEGIMDGNYVTQSLAYANEHITSNLKTQNIDAVIISQVAYLDELYPADAPNEFWYVKRKFEQGGAVATERKLLAPNGQPTNLTFQQWHLVRTPEFKAWFGDWQNDPANASKVLDENGEPLVVYHGSKNNFTVFDAGELNGKDTGFHFGTLQAANEVASLKEGENIIAVFLNIKNPIQLEEYDRFPTWNGWEIIYRIAEKIIDNESLTEQQRHYIEQALSEELSLEYTDIFGDIVFGDYPHGNNQIEQLSFLNKFLYELNIDGVFYENFIEHIGSTSYIVFNPTQIKLADGSNTTFDGSDPDIRFEEGGELKIGSSTNAGIITDETATQYKINGQWFHKSIIKPAEILQYKNDVKIDQFGKIIVWDDGEFYICVNDDKNATYVTLWKHGVEGSVGFISTDLTDGEMHGKTGKWLSVRLIEINKKYRGKGLSGMMYKMLIKFSGSDVKGILSYLPNRSNKKQIPRIYNKFSTEKEGDYQYVTKAQNIGRFEQGGTIPEIESTGYPAIDKVLEIAVPYQEELVQKRIEYAAKNNERFSDIDIEYYRIGLIIDLIKLLGRYILKTDDIKDININRSKGVIVLNAVVVRNGENHFLSTQMIIAGGYNVQVRHYRYIADTKLPVIKTSTASQNYETKLKNLTKEQKLIAELKYATDVLQRYKNDVAELQSMTEEDVWLKSLYSTWKYDENSGRTLEHFNESMKNARKEEWERHLRILKSTKHYAVEQEKTVNKLEKKLQELQSELKDQPKDKLEYFYSDELEKESNPYKIIEKATSKEQIIIYLYNYFKQKYFCNNVRKTIGKTEMGISMNFIGNIRGVKSKHYLYFLNELSLESAKTKAVMKLEELQIKKDINFEQGGAVATERKLLAPNGQPTNLTFQQWHLVRTPEFKAWFGDWQNDPANASKVVDKNGEPMVVFHGTSASFTEFKYGEFGFHFGTEDQALAIVEKYSEERQNIYKCFLNMKNPLLTIDFARWSSFSMASIFLKYKIISQSEYKKTVKLSGNEDDKYLTKLLIKKGYDGIAYNNNFEGEGKSYIVFKTQPFNIKLADGSNTTFSPSNNDIRFDDGGEVAEQTMTADVTETDAFKNWFGNSKVVDSEGKPMVVYHGTNEKFNVFNFSKIGYNSGNLGHYGYGMYFSDSVAEAKGYGNTILPCYLKIENPFYNSDENLLLLKNNGIDCIDDLVDLSIDYDSFYKEIERIDKVAAKLLTLVNENGYEKGWEIFLEDNKTSDAKIDLNNLCDVYRYCVENNGVSAYVNEYFAEWGVDVNKVKFNKGFEYQQSLHWITDLGNRSREVTEVIVQLGFDGVIVGSEYIAFYPTQIKLADGSNTTFDPSSPDIRFEQGGAVATERKLLAPNGQPTNLTFQQWHLVRTPEFKAWFGDWQNDPANASKVVDENGEPKVMWRTDGGEKIKKEYTFYSPVEWYGRDYMLLTGINLPYFILAKNIFDLQNEDDFNAYIKVKKSIYDEDSEEKYTTYKEFYDGAAFDHNSTHSEDAYDWAKEKGYDAIATYEQGIRNILKMGNLGIKLADGSNTTFDPNNPDIRFEQGGAVATERKLLAPNGQPTNLTFQQWHLVRTPEFKAWFGDWQNDPENASKVVDENGEPLVVYHGTKKRFNIFEIQNGKQNPYLLGNDNNIGFFFTNDKESAFKYGGGSIKDNERINPKDLTIMECFLNIRSPYGFTFYSYADFTKRVNDGNLMKEELEALGYDGFQIEKFYTIGVFSPTQIKLADGSNTTFDPNNPDIRFEQGGAVATDKIKYTDLPEDMQVFIFELLDTENYDEAIENIDHAVFTIKQYAIKDIPNIHAKYLDKERGGSKYAIENFGDNKAIMPVIFMNGNLVDGYHRTYAKKKAGNKFIGGIDLNEILESNYRKGAAIKITTFDQAKKQYVTFGQFSMLKSDFLGLLLVNKKINHKTYTKLLKRKDGVTKNELQQLYDNNRDIFDNLLPDHYKKGGIVSVSEYQKALEGLEAMIEYVEDEQTRKEYQEDIEKLKKIIAEHQSGVASYKVKEKVLHRTFGTGIIKAINNDILTIEFDSIGKNENPVKRIVFSNLITHYVELAEQADIEIADVIEQENLEEGIVLIKEKNNEIIVMNNDDDETDDVPTKQSEDDDEEEDTDEEVEVVKPEKKGISHFGYEIK